MSHPKLATTIAAGLLLGGFTPVLANALSLPGPPPCATYADPGENDATVNGSGQSYDANLDILTVTLGGGGSDVVATLKIKDLKDQPTGGADSFRVDVTVGGKIMEMFAYRDAVRGKSAKLVNFSDSRNGTATAAFDATADTVTITSTAAQFDAALGSASAGQDGISVRAEAAVAVDGVAQTVFYDNATAPDGFKYPVGTPCEGGGTGPGPGEGAAGYPKPDCNTVADIAGDAHLVNSNVPNDSDYDLRGVALQLTPTALKAFVRVEQLATKPQRGVGHTFYVNFTSGDHTVSLVTRAYDPATLGQPRAMLADATADNVGLSPDTALLVDGGYEPSGITAAFELDKSMVVYTVPRDELVALAPAFTKGAEITALTVRSATAVPMVADVYADSTAASNGATGTDKWTVGDNTCFVPLPAKIVNVGKTTAQFTDAAAVAAKLTEADGTPLAARLLVFGIGVKRVYAKTGPDGVAKALYNPGQIAGRYTMSVTFPGDDTAGEHTAFVPFTVTVEKTAITFAVTKSGTKRYVVAKLADDDKHAVTGQTITLYVNGKKVSSPKTGSAGTVKLTALAGQTVTAKYAGVVNRYVKSSYSKKV